MSEGPAKKSQWVGKPKPKAVRDAEKQPAFRRKSLEQQWREKWREVDLGYVDKRTGEHSLCWMWFGANNGKGPDKSYGIFGRPKQYAHRFAYELLVGPIPDGLVIDHLCRHRLCQNPKHHEPITRLKNLKRGVNANFRSNVSGMCARNLHSLDDATEEGRKNVYYRADGRAFCKRCADEARRRRRVQEKSAPKSTMLGLGGQNPLRSGVARDIWGNVIEEE